MSDPRLAGFMAKYGAQRATDDGPVCPDCGRVVTRSTADAWYGPLSRREPIRHQTCADRARERESADRLTTT